MKQTKLLVILDGWGHSDTIEHNAIQQAKTPFFDKLIDNNPHTLINTSGEEVGLLGGQMGNSEVGHLNLGAGRVVNQELSRIHNEIKTKDFFKNKVFVDKLNYASVNNKAVHIMGLLSDGGVHSHISHIEAMLEMAKLQGCKEVYLHLFTDGRDCPPTSAKKYIHRIEEKIQVLGVGKIATIIGRYFAMDRDNHWDRVEQAFNLIMNFNADFNADSANKAIVQAYNRGEVDEFIQATTIKGGKQINDDDILLFMNYRADRARQITMSFIYKNFDGFTRINYKKTNFVCLTEYKKDFDVSVAYSATSLKNVLGEYLSKLEKTQLRIAETEKYAHVTFFFNGGREEPFNGEERILIPSPNVRTYNLKPEMSAYELTDRLVENINSKKYDVIICNYANTDMVGHSGNLAATIKAVEAIDCCLEKVVNSIKSINGEMLITADHGNAEKMFDKATNEIHTAHTINPVPLIFIGRNSLKFNDKIGSLADIAPTILKLMNLKQPIEMTGKSLLL